jgi:hypothetical protein
MSVPPVHLYNLIITLYHLMFKMQEIQSLRFYRRLAEISFYSLEIWLSLLSTSRDIIAKTLQKA